MSSKKGFTSKKLEGFSASCPTWSDQVQHRLPDKSYSVALLRQIGGELGIRIPSRANRSSVIDTIAGKLANRRGYDILRHGGNAR